MGEFKGTKGKWGFEEKLMWGYINITHDSGDQRLAEIIVNTFSDNGEEEGMANALLISKAPEMLEILKELMEDLEDEAITSGVNDTIRRCKKLIKEATEL